MIVGGFIGYVTNWLAIKMLFRPYREIRILGIKLPFTPGLIPKERNRIATSIGESVGVNLLSPEVVTNALSKPEMNENINRWIKDKIFKFRDNHNSINSILLMQGIEKYEELIDYLNTKIIVFIYSKIDNEDFKNHIVHFAEDILYSKYGVEVKEFVYGQINNILIDFLNSSKLQNEIELGIQSIIDNLKSDNRTLSEALPYSITDSIKNYIDEEKDVIVSEIIGMIKNPEIQDKLKSSLADLINQNLSKVFTIFITPEQISEKVFLSLEKHIDSPEVKESIIYIVKNSIDKILSNKVADIGKDILNVISNGETNIFTDIIMEYISVEANQEKLVNLVKEKFDWESISLRTKILTFVSQGIDKILNLDEFREIIADIVEVTLADILDQPISSIFIDLDINEIDSITETLNRGFHNLTNTHLPDIITTMNISSIVEEQINSFEVEETERLILEIARKELAAITWVGALLGIIIGLLTPLIQILY